MGGMKSGSGETMPEIPEWLKAEVQPMMRNSVNRFRQHQNFGAGIGMPQMMDSPTSREEFALNNWDPSFLPGIANPWAQPGGVGGDGSGATKG